ncbi:MAG: DUF2939 domain-containing protein [Pacificimonas sp.]|nr:DUF2939 domain-containing protein [Pacificimonas sp.]
MKTFIWLITGAVVAAAVWFFAAPYWTIGQMSAAVRAGDDAAFSGYVDYDAVRQNLARDLSADLPLGDGPLARMGRRVAEGAAEDILERGLTPDAIAVLIAGLDGRADAPHQDGRAVADALSDLDIKRDLTGFTLSYGGTERARFTRDGLKYRLTALYPPESRAELLDLLGR